MGWITCSRKVARGLQLTAFVASFMTSTSSWSQAMTDATKTCVDAYGKAQEQRNKDDLLKAREALRSCSATTCPTIIQSDCTTWLAEVVEAIPSIVLEARLDNESVFDVSVSMDGAPLVSQLDGKPIEVNPGLHTFLFERPGNSPVDKKVIVAAHRRSQMLSVGWKTSASAAVALGPARLPIEARATATRPVPALVYVLGGTAIAGFATFAILGIDGSATQRDLESSCSPHCSDGAVASLQTRFLAADIAVVVGALSAAGALTVFLTRPEREMHPLQASSIGIRPVKGGATVDWNRSF